MKEYAVYTEKDRNYNGCFLNCDLDWYDEYEDAEAAAEEIAADGTKVYLSMAIDGDFEWTETYNDED